jgi:hypothetical protein
MGASNEPKLEWPYEAFKQLVEKLLAESKAREDKHKPKSSATKKKRKKTTRRRAPKNSV